MSQNPQETQAELGTVAVVGVALAGVATVAVVAASTLGSRRASNAQEDSVAKKIKEPIWPIPLQQVVKVGDTVVAQRPGSHQPHKGLDIFAAAGTEVRAATSGAVLRVVNGSEGTTDKQHRAGLFVDVKDASARIYRYLHLGSVALRRGRRLQAGDRIQAGDPIGTVAPTGESGVLHSAPHLHFEVRLSDYDRSQEDYGAPIDPLSVLPLRLGKRSLT
jgi:murein DD-endopeptidase MepM/ murein hydrolase activator NlpD